MSDRGLHPSIYFISSFYKYFIAHTWALPGSILGIEETEMSKTNEGPSLMDPVRGNIQGIINKAVKDVISVGDMCFLGNKTSEVRGREWEDSLRQGAREDLRFELIH